MPTKRHIAPTEEALLKLVISAIEDDKSEASDSIHTSALNLLLRYGPVVCRETDADPAFLLRLELLAFLRSIVRDSDAGRESYTGMELSPIRLTAQITNARTGRVQLAASGSARALVKLQLFMLLQMVGLRNVRECPATDCQRIFVKRYSRKYCSRRCQNNTLMREQRKQEAIERERAESRRRRAR